MKTEEKPLHVITTLNWGRFLEYCKNVAGLTISVQKVNKRMRKQGLERYLYRKANNITQRDEIEIYIEILRKDNKVLFSSVQPKSSSYCYRKLVREKLEEIIRRGEWKV